VLFSRLSPKSTEDVLEKELQVMFGIHALAHLCCRIHHLLVKSPYF
jgi:hypothetical protein